MITTTSGLSYYLNSDNTTYSVRIDGSSLQYTSGQKFIIIPDTVNGYTVTDIRSMSAPSTSGWILVLPYTLKTIQTGAFATSYSNLRAVLNFSHNISLRNSSKIGSLDNGSAGLYECDFVDFDTKKEYKVINAIRSESAFNTSALSTTQYDLILSEIGYNAFAGSKTINSVVLSEKITAIPDDAFRSSTVRQVTYDPSHLESIGDGAFEYCSNLISFCPKTISVGDAVPEHILKKIGRGAFISCINLEHLFVQYYTGKGYDMYNPIINLPHLEELGFSALAGTVKAGIGPMSNHKACELVVPNRIEIDLFNLTATSIGIKFIDSDSGHYEYDSGFWCEYGYNDVKYAYYYYIPGVRDLYTDTIPLPSTIPPGINGLVRCFGNTYTATVQDHEMIIPSTITSLDESFNGSAYTYWSLNGTEAPIPDFENKLSTWNLIFEDTSKITNIGAFTFYGNLSIKHFIVGPSCHLYDFNEFYGCVNLKHVVNKSSMAITAGSTSYGYIAYYCEEGGVTTRVVAWIKYELDGGSFSFTSNPQEFSSQSDNLINKIKARITTETPTKTDYEFECWDTLQGGEEVDLEPFETLTIRAIWRTAYVTYYAWVHLNFNKGKYTGPVEDSEDNWYEESAKEVTLQYSLTCKKSEGVPTSITVHPNTWPKATRNNPDIELKRLYLPKTKTFHTFDEPISVPIGNITTPLEVMYTWNHWYSASFTIKLNGGRYTGSCYSRKKDENGNDKLITWTNATGEITHTMYHLEEDVESEYTGKITEQFGGSYLPKVNNNTVTIGEDYVELKGWKEYGSDGVVWTPGVMQSISLYAGEWMIIECVWDYVLDIHWIIIGPDDAIYTDGHIQRSSTDPNTILSARVTTPYNVISASMDYSEYCVAGWSYTPGSNYIDIPREGTVDRVYGGVTLYAVIRYALTFKIIDPTSNFVVYDTEPHVPDIGKDYFLEGTIRSLDVYETLSSRNKNNFDTEHRIYLGIFNDKDLTETGSKAYTITKHAIPVYVHWINEYVAQIRYQDTYSTAYVDEYAYSPDKDYTYPLTNTQLFTSPVVKGIKLRFKGWKKRE